MRRLSREAWERARSFLGERARPIDHALFEYTFEEGERESVLRVLATYQNSDGGFGNALEPDVRLPASSVVATVTALQILRGLEVGADHPMVAGAVPFLLEGYREDLEGWLLVPKEVDDFPRAPWWDYERNARSPIRVNPGAEILGHLYRYSELVPDDGFLEKLAHRTRSHLLGISEDVGPDALLCCSRLVETVQVPPSVREPIQEKLIELGGRAVSRDPTLWSSYSAKPLKLAPLPDSVLGPSLADEVALNLDYEIEHQSEDGSWSPNWSWGDRFPEDWKRAEQEWKGELTLRTLESLHAHGRLDPG